MSLYTDLIGAGQPVSNWQSDLYCPVNEVTRALLKQHDKKATAFKSKIDQKLWFEVPFAYDPYWEKRGMK